ncbi:hypothetical protein AB0M28_01450 [Streptomyces sp. NPDC051940]|uniref:hypothetical protein n=1 Tax=Streptomyces sp. NPDC051940 TaxID=3155675 RepID=UPI0034477F63
MIGTDRARLGDRVSERWSTLPPRLRRTAIGALLLVLIAAWSGYYAATRPPAPAAPPAPWPFQSTRFHYLGLTSQPTPDKPYFGMRIAITVIRGPTVRIDRLAPDFAQLKITTNPPLPAGFTAGGTRNVELRMTVSRCSGLPLDGRLPYLNVTLRNTRAIETQAWIPGGDYAEDLSASLHAVCDP